MQKIECKISQDKIKVIDIICDKNGYTRAEFNRRAVDFYLEDVLSKPSLDDKITNILNDK